MTTAALVSIAAVAGLLIGSFLTVVVDRVPRGASVVQPGSACGACGLELGPLDLVPVFSWLILGGKCRRCRTRIGVEPLVLELATAGTFVAMALHFARGWETRAYCALCAGLLALSWIDLRTKRLPARSRTSPPRSAPAARRRGARARRAAPHRDDARGRAIALAFMGLLYVASRGGWATATSGSRPLLGGYLGWLGLGLRARPGCSSASCSARSSASRGWWLGRPVARRACPSARSSRSAPSWPSSSAAG
jgi:leader peptidase (prepilin peptidase)/N-methyltransferase